MELHFIRQLKRYWLRYPDRRFFSTLIIPQLLLLRHHWIVGDDNSCSSGGDNSKQNKKRAKESLSPTVSSFWVIVPISAIWLR
jgi:hypothetical protein